MKRVTIALRALVYVPIDIEEEQLAAIQAVIKQDSLSICRKWMPNIYSDGFAEKFGDVVEAIRAEITAQGDRAIVRANIEDVIEHASPGGPVGDESVRAVDEEGESLRVAPEQKAARRRLLTRLGDAANTTPEDEQAILAEWNRGPVNARTDEDNADSTEASESERRADACKITARFAALAADRSDVELTDDDLASFAPDEESKP